MEFIRGIHNLRPRHKGCVVTIGNFDGVHLGHLAVLDQLNRQAEKLNLPSVVLLFEPQPQEYFAGDSAPARLLRLREKIIALNGLVDRVLCCSFNASFAGLSDEDFVTDILQDALGAEYVVVGDDFRFGKNRTGNFDKLVQMGISLGFDVARQETFCFRGERVSSTRIRTVLKQGDMDHAAELLGHPYTIGGHVAYGHQMGRTIGFPTANIYMHRQTPVRGVYAVRMTGLEDGAQNGIANIGFRPTVEEDRKVPLLETHLFDFDQQIYGRYVEVEFLSRIRDEKKFDSFEHLKKQIELDAEQARQYFSETL